MEKETVIIKEPKRTNKLVVVLIVIFTVVLTFLPIIGIMYLVFFSDSVFNTEFKENNYGEIIVDDDAKISNVDGYYDNVSNNYYVQGYLENLDDDKIEFVSIEYLVYDKNNVLLGTAYASIDNISANTKWKFKAIYDGIDSNEVVKYELSSVELY